MSKRAEKAALRAYPKEIRDKNGIVIDIGHPQWIRDYYIHGYEQAEKDLALTWKDIAMIDAIILDTNNEFAIDSSKKIIGQNFYEEVLERFNEQKKK